MLELSRAEILDRFRKSLAEGNILLGVGAGTGITAKSAEAGGADIFVIYNSGRFRMAGRGSLAGLLSYGDANQIVVEMGAALDDVVGGLGPAGARGAGRGARARGAAVGPADERGRRAGRPRGDDGRRGAERAAREGLVHARAEAGRALGAAEHGERGGRAQEVAQERGREEALSRRGRRGRCAGCAACEGG